MAFLMTQLIIFVIDAFIYFYCSIDETARTGQAGYNFSNKTNTSFKASSFYNYHVFTQPAYLTSLVAQGKTLYLYTLGGMPNPHSF